MMCRSTSWLLPLLAVAFAGTAVAAPMSDEISYGTGPGTAYYSVPIPGFITGIGGGNYPTFSNQAVLIYNPGPGNVVDGALWLEGGSLDFKSTLDGILADLPLSVPVVATIVADGAYQDVGSLLLTGPFPANYVLVKTDIAAVPEPSSLVFFCVGLAAVVGVARRRSA